MKPLKIGAYIRVSTTDQVNVFEGSLDSQKHRINEFVQYKNRQEKSWGNIIEYYIEEGVSAGTTNRPMYQKIMADVRKGKINLVLVSDLTRLSRNLLDFCTLINELEKHKASYLSMKEQFDTSTPIGRMMVYIIIALGQFEREQTAERVSANCHSRAMRGLRNGGAIPFGYDRHPEKPGLLIVNEDEAQIVQTIFKTFLESGSRSKTIEKLREIGIQPKRMLKKTKERGGTDWSVQSIGNLLQEAVYVGFKEVNKIYKNQDQSSLKPWQKYQMVKSASPAIIDEAIFFDAQKLLKEAREKERTRHGKREKRIFLLSGILTCSETGLPLVGQAGHSKNGTVHRYYHYVRRPKGVANVRRRLNADELEEKLMNEFKASLKTTGYFENLEKALLDQAQKKNKSTESERTRSERELTELQRRISTIWSNQARMQLSEEALQLASEELNSLAKRKTELEKYMQQLGPVDDTSKSCRDQVLFVQNQIQALLQGWPKATPEARKRLLRRTIKEIVVSRTEMKIIFWLNADMSTDGTRGPTNDCGVNENVVPFRRNSPSALDRNLSTDCSGKVLIGRG